MGSSSIIDVSAACSDWFIIGIATASSCCCCLSMGSDVVGLKVLSKAPLNPYAPSRIRIYSFDKNWPFFDFLTGGSDFPFLVFVGR
ncbi:hypothetical protein AAHA92_06963 [Salvia divinorum]|uniref:Uncharacterized protein n=1 Tax=Salvia divinorum TaxID=28513 RepID=A0ABD1IA01_SALDI